MKDRIVPTLMVAGVVSLLLSLLLGGFIVYQWVLAFEATAASAALFVFGIRIFVVIRANPSGRRSYRWL